MKSNARGSNGRESASSQRKPEPAEAGWARVNGTGWRLGRPLGSFAVAILLAASTRIVSAADPVTVQAAKPSRGEIHRFVTLPGGIRANQQATLYAKVPGYLKSLTVDKGDAVKAGQPLGEIEVPELAAELVKYKAERKVAEIELTRLSAARSKAPDLVTPQSVDDAQGRFDVAAANIERIETLLKYSRLTAPFDAVVTARFVDPGAFIPSATSGSAAGNAAVVTLMDFNTVRVQVPVPEAEAALVKVGQPVKFTVDVLKGREFDASVSRLSYAIDAATQTMLIEADVPNPDLVLRPGMFVTARIGVENHAAALTIPTAALLVEKAATSVFINQSGTARKTPVKAGFNDGTKVEVLSGLTGGESVILLPKTPLADGAAINVTEAP